RWSPADMPKGRGSPQPSRSPMMMVGSSFMVPKPAATPSHRKSPCRQTFEDRPKRRQSVLGHAGGVMATGFEVRMGKRKDRIREMDFWSQTVELARPGAKGRASRRGSPYRAAFAARAFSHTRGEARRQLRASA